MKSLFVFLFSILILNNCTAQNEHDSLTINYNASTRGSNILLVVIPSQITYVTNSESKKIELSKVQWHEIEGMVLKIELNTISNLEAPSNERYTDGALIASILINKNKVDYESSQFDHGNPPEELKELIDFIFDLVYNHSN